MFEDPNELPDNWEWLVPEDVTVLVADGETADVDVFNKYTAPDPDLGSLTITKKLSNNSDPYTGSRKFQIGIAPALRPVSLNGDGDTQYISLEIDESRTLNLPLGVYDVWEVTDGLPSNWKCETGPETIEVAATHAEEHTIYNTYTAPESPPPPPPPDTSLLTVYYKEWGTDDAVHAPTTHSGLVGSSQVVNAFTIEGYELREGTDASYAHVFTSGNATHTFWYEMVIEDDETPLAPTGGIPGTTMYGIGISLLGLGLATKKRRRK